MYMDNSNANNGGLSPFGLKRSNDEAKNRPKAHTHKPLFEPKLVNAQTQSIIESPRERYQEDIAKAAAYQAQMQEQYRQEQAKQKAKKTSVYVAFGIFGLIFLIVLIMLLIAIANTSFGSPAQSVRPEEEQGSQGADVISGYKCKSNKCELMDEMPDGRMLIHDADGYYTYDLGTTKAVLTSIENKDYSSIKTFNWSDKILAVISPTTDKKALYSITDNKMITQYEYDEFYTDFNNKEIYNSSAVKPELYIIARTSSPKQYFLVDLQTGLNLVRGQEGIYTDGVFYFGYEAGGLRHVYAEGSATAFLITSDAELYTRNGILIEITSSNNSVRIKYYDKNGEHLNTRELPFGDELKSTNNELVANTIRNSTKYLKIPTK